MRDDKLRPWVLPAASLAAYTLAGFLTFGATYNNCVRANMTPYQFNWCTYGGGIASFVWPLYWAGVASIEVTK